MRTNFYAGYQNMVLLTIITSGLKKNSFFLCIWLIASGMADYHR